MNMRWQYLVSILLAGAALAVAQVETVPSNGKDPGKSDAPPRYDQPTGGDRQGAESSSRGSLIDLTPPDDDAKSHPDSSVPQTLADDSDVKEFRPWDPHRALKDIEVGDFYFKRKNYKAALDRYNEALEYKPNDALANYKLGVCLEKLNLPEDAVSHYQEYLKVLPQGEFAPEVKKSLERLNSEGKAPPPTKAQSK